MAKRRAARESEQTTLDLPVALTQDELVDYGRRAAQLMARAEALDEQRLEASKAQRQAISEIRNEARVLLADIRRGAVDRPVVCSIEHDAKAGTVETIRRDTGEVVARRPLTDSERQGRLFDLGIRDELAPAVEP